MTNAGLGLGEPLIVCWGDDSVGKWENQLHDQTSTEALWCMLPETAQKRQTKLQRKNTHHRKSKSTWASGQWDGWAAKGTFHQRHEPNAPSPTPQSCPLAHMKMPGLCFPPCPSINPSSFLGQAEQLSRAHLLPRLKTQVPHPGLTVEGQKWLKKVALWRHTKLTN